MTGEGDGWMNEKASGLEKDSGVTGWLMDRWREEGKMDGLVGG